MQLAPGRVEVVESSDTCGTLATNYRVVDRDAKTLANIRQLTSLVEQARQIDVRVQFEPVAERASACEVVSRIAVRDEDFSMTRGLQGIDLPTAGSQATCQWLGIAETHVPLAVLCDLPRVHRRHAGRMLDTTLVETGGKSTAAPPKLRARLPVPSPIVSSLAGPAVDYQRSRRPYRIKRVAGGCTWEPGT